MTDVPFSSIRIEDEKSEMLQLRAWAARAENKRRRAGTRRIRARTTRSHFCPKIFVIGIVSIRKSAQHSALSIQPKRLQQLQGKHRGRRKLLHSALRSRHPPGGIT